MANNWPFDPSQTDAYNDARLTYIQDHVFGPYETANNLVGYFGVVTRKGGWKACKDMGGNVPATNRGTVTVFSPGFVDDLTLTGV